MKYSELEKLLRKIGCYPTGEKKSGPSVVVQPRHQQVLHNELPSFGRSG